jgi:hypothetical protein
MSPGQILDTPFDDSFRHRCSSLLLGLHFPKVCFTNFQTVVLHCLKIRRSQVRNSARCRFAADSLPIRCRFAVLRGLQEADAEDLVQHVLLTVSGEFMKRLCRQYTAPYKQ